MPAAGMAPGVVNAKAPDTEPAPPLSVEAASVWPSMMAEAVGQAVTLGVALFTVRVATALVVLP